jgi:hypothetical protein
MSEPKFDLAADESEHDLGPRSRPSGAPEDHLQTTRLPAISPPPPGLFSSSPPSAVVAVAPRLPSFDPSSGESIAPPSSITDVPPVRPSWLRGLLTTTFPPARAEILTVDERVLRRRTGSIAAVLALALVIASLVVGLRAAPAAEPAVAATVVAVRAAMALGLLAFAFALIRTAERLFFVVPPVDAAAAAPAQEAMKSPGTH